MSTLTTTPAVASPALKVTQGRVLRSEFTKFRSLRSTAYTLLTAVALMVGLGAIFSAVTASQYHTFNAAARASFNPVTTSLSGVLFAVVAFGVLGVLVTSGEYSTGMIRAKEPPRGPIPPREDWYDYVAADAMPTIAIIQDIDDRPGFGAFWGEVQTTVHAALGVKGCVTNGSFRDIDMLAPGFQIVGGRVGPSHAHVHMTQMKCDVTIFGMLARHDDVIHADVHGAVVDAVGAEEVGDFVVLRRRPLDLGLILELRGVVDIDLDRQNVADLMRALVLEEGARAVAPQRVRIVARRLRRRHRHLHRLVAGLGLRIVDRRQMRLLADLAEPVDGGAAAHQRRQRERRYELERTRAHDQRMTLGHGTLLRST